MLVKEFDTVETARYGHDEDEAERGITYGEVHSIVGWKVQADAVAELLLGVAMEDNVADEARPRWRGLVVARQRSSEAWRWSGTLSASTQLAAR